MYFLLIFILYRLNYPDFYQETECFENFKLSSRIWMMKQYTGLNNTWSFSDGSILGRTGWYNKVFRIMFKSINYIYCQGGLRTLKLYYTNYHQGCYIVFQSEAVIPSHIYTSADGNVVYLCHVCRSIKTWAPNVS